LIAGILVACGTLNLHGVPPIRGQSPLAHDRLRHGQRFGSEVLERSRMDEWATRSILSVDGFQFPAGAERTDHCRHPRQHDHAENQSAGVHALFYTRYTFDVDERGEVAT